MSWFCKHNFEEESRETIISPHWYGAHVWKDTHKTVITLKCAKCSKYRQESLDGIVRKKNECQ